MRWCKICGRRFEFQPGPLGLVNRCEEHRLNPESDGVVPSVIGCGLLLGLIGAVWGMVIYAMFRWLFH